MMNKGKRVLGVLLSALLVAMCAPSVVGAAQENVAVHLKLSALPRYATMNIYDGGEAVYSRIYDANNTIYLTPDKTYDFAMGYLDNGGANPYFKATGQITVAANGTVTTQNFKNIAAKVGASGEAMATSVAADNTITITVPATTKMDATCSLQSLRPIPNFANGGDASVKDSAGMEIPWYSVGAAYIYYRMPVGTYTYKLFADECLPTSGTIKVNTTSSVTFTPADPADLTNGVVSITGNGGSMVTLNATLKAASVRISAKIKPEGATLTLKDGDTPLVPQSGNVYMVSLAGMTADKELSYEIACDNFKTIKGTLVVKPNGTVTDTSDATQVKNDTVSYAFDAANKQFDVRMTPAVSIEPNGPGTATADLTTLARYMFQQTMVNDTVYPGAIIKGKVFLTNPNDRYNYVFASADFTANNTSEPKLTTMLRTRNEAVRWLFSDLGTTPTIKKVNEITTHISSRFALQGITTYYDYLVYYFKANLSGNPAYAKYADITSLDELDPLDQAKIFYDSNVTYDVSKPEYDLAPGEETQDSYEPFGAGEYAILESDARVDKLGRDLFFGYSTFFSFDTTKIDQQMKVLYVDSNPNLSIGSYYNSTQENKALTKEAFAGKVFSTQSTILLDQLGFSIAGDTVHNGYQRRDFTYDLMLHLNFYVVGIDGFVFEDANKDGVFSAGEAVFPNTSVRLVDENDVTVATTQSDAQGYYLFPDVAPGTYKIVIETPEGYFVTSVTRMIGDPASRDYNVFAAQGNNASTSAFSAEGDTNYHANCGFVRKDEDPVVPVDPVDPTKPSDPTTPTVDPTPKDPRVPDTKKPSVPAKTKHAVPVKQSPSAPTGDSGVTMALILALAASLFVGVTSGLYRNKRRKDTTL